MKIAVALQTHAYQTLVTVEQKQNAKEEPIHVQKGFANVVEIMNAQKMNCVSLVNVKVCEFI